MDTDLELLRPLGVVEEFFWLFDHRCPKQFCLAAETKGRTLGTNCRRLWVHCRHVIQCYLFRSIPRNSEYPHFHRGSQRPIPLRVAPSGATWKREAEREITTLFDPTEGPLARMVLIHELEKSFVLLVTHHAIAYGLSSIFMLRDLISAMSGPQLDHYEFLHSIDQELDAPTRPSSAPGKKLSHTLAVECLKQPAVTPTEYSTLW